MMFAFPDKVIICQEKETLRKKIDQVRIEIKYLNKLLEKREGEKENYVNHLKLVEKKINSQKKYVFALESEISNLERIIKEYEKIIENLSDKLNSARRFYGDALRNYYLKRDKIYFWVLILAADNFLQSQRRIIFYRQYINELKVKAQNIEELMAEINFKKKESMILLNERKFLLKLKESEIQKLDEDKRMKKMLLEKIKREESSIRRKINEKKKIANKLEEEMKKVIAEEVKRSKGKNAIYLTAEEKILAGTFEKNKGRLPWPVKNGVIVDRFGEHQHVALKNVKVRNNGIDIETEKNSEISAIYDGVVTKIVNILGAKFTIIIRHGNYLSVYQNIDDVLVKTGERVATGQIIGRVKSFEGNENPVIHFEIWKDFNRMDPEEWIKKK